MGRGRQTNQWHPPPPAKKKCPPRKVVSKPSTQPRQEKSGYKEVVIDSDLILLSPEEPVVPEWYDIQSSRRGYTALSVSTTRTALH